MQNKFTPKYKWNLQEGVDLYLLYCEVQDIQYKYMYEYIRYNDIGILNYEIFI